MRLSRTISQWQNTDFHSFLWILWLFLLFLPVFTCFCGFLDRRDRRLGDLQPCQRPNRTLRLGCVAAAMGLFRALTMGVASLKRRITTAASLGSSAASAGKVALMPHCLQRIKSSPGCSHGKPL